MNINQYLDFWDVFVNELVGSAWLFIFLAIVVILFLAIRLKLTLPVTSLLVFLFLAIVFAKSFEIVIWLFPVLILSGFFYYMYQKPIRGG